MRSRWKTRKIRKKFFFCYFASTAKSLALQLSYAAKICIRTFLRFFLKYSGTASSRDFDIFKKNQAARYALQRRAYGIGSRTLSNFRAFLNFFEEFLVGFLLVFIDFEVHLWTAKSLGAHFYIFKNQRMIWLATRKMETFYIYLIANYNSRQRYS